MVQTTRAPRSVLLASKKIAAKGQEYRLPQFRLDH